MAGAQRTTEAKTTIRPASALYIKLGEGGRWERECVQSDQTLRLDYREVPHSACLKGEWDRVRDFLIERGNHKGTAQNHTNQIRLFYESLEDVLWITFFANRLWWCFSKPEITLLSDNTKTRPAVGCWTCHDVEGTPLDMSRLSGKLLSTQGFRGTICRIKPDYVVRKINATDEPQVLAANEARRTLVEAIKPIISHLHWRDFELLVDLIFRQAGWSRISELGMTVKTLDLVLAEPITNRRYAVQIKSQADLATFETCCNQFESMEGFERLYFVVHSLSPDLSNARQRDDVEILGPAQLAEWSVRYGLVDWLIDKAG